MCGREWRSRYFHLHHRRIYYFECEEDAVPVDGKTFHKGYIDLVGARVDVFEDSDDNGDYFGFQVVEEYGLEGDGKGSGETQGHKLRLCSSHEEQRDQWCARRQPRLRWPLARPRLDVERWRCWAQGELHQGGVAADVARRGGDEGRREIQALPVLRKEVRPQNAEIALPPLRRRHVQEVHGRGGAAGDDV